jgi:hypothetical protein
MILLTGATGSVEEAGQVLGKLVLKVGPTILPLSRSGT